MIKNIFANREEAGNLLAAKLQQYKNCQGTILAIPRGGVVIGYYLAKELNLPLDVLCVKKIGAPNNPEYAIGAVFQDGTTIINPGAARHSLPENYFEEEKQKQLEKIKEIRKLYGVADKKITLDNKISFLVDDGIATGSTILVAAQALRQKNPKKIIIAVPVAPFDALERLQRKVDEVVCISTPESFFAVGQFYDDFSQVTDEEVKKYLSGFED